MNESIAPPYPADTLSRGWRFEVDMETFKRSDTWKKAKTGAMRGALLLLWAEAWQEKPCGTLPDDDELIALMIDMAPTVFEKNRAVLRRGWAKASDGRLYHETITARVLAMLDKRANDAQRAATRRARKAESDANTGGVTDASRVTHTGVGPEFDTKHQAPSTKENTSEPIGSGASAPRLKVVGMPPDDKDLVFANGVALLTSAGVKESNARSFLAAQCKAHGDAAVRAALDRCASERPVQPVPWLTAALGTSPSRPRKSDTLMAGNIAAAQRFMETTND